MSDNELLLAISNMMDTKLKTELQPIKNDLQEVKADVQGLKEDVQGLKEDVQVLKEDVQVLKEKVQVLEEDVHGLKENVQILNNRMHVVEIGLRDVKLYQENVIMPRLETIESCYTDTYNRYRTYADMMEEYFEDTKMLKKVVANLSEQVQKLA